MRRITARVLAGLVMLMALTAAQGTTLAGPYLGDWTWFWHPAHDCPHGGYSPAHYWLPGWYQARAYVHPSHLDQYPPGPMPSIPPSYEVQKYPCRSNTPTPTSPYREPAAYYGREIAPIVEEKK